MSVIGKGLKRGILRLERLQGNPVFTWMGSDYPCAENIAGASKVLGLAGYGLEADLTLFARTEALPNPRPQEEKTLKFKAKKYRIKTISGLPGDDVVRMACMTAT